MAELTIQSEHASLNNPASSRIPKTAKNKKQRKSVLLPGSAGTPIGNYFKVALQSAVTILISGDSLAFPLPSHAKNGISTIFLPSSENLIIPTPREDGIVEDSFTLNDL